MVLNENHSVFLLPLNWYFFGYFLFSHNIGSFIIKEFLKKKEKSNLSSSKLKYITETINKTKEQQKKKNNNGMND